jgi:hypothetical protein
MSQGLSLYWQHEAAARLIELGARSVPVLVRGNDWTFAQDLDDVAEFVGDPDRHERLDAETLVARTQAFLALSRDYTAAFPSERLDDAWPGRNRTVTDLIFHIQMVVIGFLDAANGGELTEAHFERKPAPGEDDPEALVRLSEYVSRELGDWWAAVDKPEPTGMLRTYYGQFDIGPVLERTAWHAGQHVRQLCEMLIMTETSGVERPARTLLDGLPIPAEVWDRD